MSEETDRGFHELKQQVALLRQENAATRAGWLKWMRSTGQLLLVYAVAVLLGVLSSHGKIESSPVGITLGITAIFMGACGLWCLLWSFRWMFQRLLRNA